MPVRHGFAPLMRDTVAVHFAARMSKPLFKSFLEVIGALLVLSSCARGWYGRLSLGDIARAMSTPGNAKNRLKRLDRFLRNTRLNGSLASGGLLSFSGVSFWGAMVPVLIDQTSLCADAVQAIVASFPFGNRSIPLAFEVFQAVDAQHSQNAREWTLLQRVLARLQAMRSVLIMDRGYAKRYHLQRLLKHGAMFVIRGCRNVIVQYHDGSARRCSIERLRHRQGVPVRYRNVTYMHQGGLRVDIIVFRGKGFAEPWFLIVPPDSDESMPTEQVVQWYRWRMRIEVTFRDFKSCLGVRRGLRFAVEPAEKMARMLCCLSVVYIILMGLSQTRQARHVRKDMEMRRRTSRHGTRRTLSVLSIATLMIIHSLADQLRQLLAAVMRCWDQGVFSPLLDQIA